MGCWQSTVTREDALHLTPPFPPCWGTHSAKKPGLSTVLPVTKAEPWPQAPTPAWDFWISDLPRLPQVPSEMPFYLPVHCGCPAALQTPAVPQGHLSPSTARITSEPRRRTVASLPAELPVPTCPLSAPKHTHCPQESSRCCRARSS